MKELFPPLVDKITISCIVSPNYNNDNDFSKQLKDYFKTYRLIKIIYN